MVDAIIILSDRKRYNKEKGGDMHPLFSAAVSLLCFHWFVAIFLECTEAMFEWLMGMSVESAYSEWIAVHTPGFMTAVMSVIQSCFEFLNFSLPTAAGLVCKEILFVVSVKRAKMQRLREKRCRYNVCMRVAG